MIVEAEVTQKAIQKYGKNRKEAQDVKDCQ